MITASEIYWILKLDDIRTMLYHLVAFGGVIFVTIGIAWCINRDSYDWKPENALFYKKNLLRIFGIGILIAAIATIAPSTKQMAAIKVIPAIANSEIVGELSADAKEIYRMGINAIKEQLTGNNKEGEK